MTTSSTIPKKLLVRNQQKRAVPAVAPKGLRGWPCRRARSSVVARDVPYSNPTRRNPHQTPGSPKEHTGRTGERSRRRRVGFSPILTSSDAPTDRRSGALSHKPPRNTTSGSVRARIVPGPSSLSCSLTFPSALAQYPTALPSPRGSAPPVNRNGSPSESYSTISPWALPSQC